MSIKVLSKIQGVPQTNIPSTSNSSCNCKCKDDSKHPVLTDPPKVWIVRSDNERFKIKREQLNSWDIVRVTSGGNEVYRFFKGETVEEDRWEVFEGELNEWGLPIIEEPPVAESDIVKVSQQITFVNESEKIITHNMDTTELIAQMYDMNHKSVLCSFTIIDENNIQINTEVPLNETFKIVLIG